MSTPPTHAKRIGGYVVEREIGRGGMGVVYLAQDLKLGRKVAIKSLPAEVAMSGERLSRFRREARVLASLSHANIAVVHGLEEVEGEGGGTYLVMEFVEGRTLAERLADGALPIDQALAVCVQIAAGVESAHEAGVIHRDLKPGNVIVGEGGGVKVLDFGLARPLRQGREIGSDIATAPSGPVTEEGAILGTPGYMSPEQARGRPVDKRADLFSLGAIIYECLTGCRAFAGGTATDAIAASLEREPEWRALPERTPWRVQELLKQCLEKDATKRLRDAGDARLVLEAAIAGREWANTAVMAAAPRAGWSAGRWATLAVGAAAMFLVGGMVSLLMSPRAGPADVAVREAVRFAIPIPSPAPSTTEHPPRGRFALSPDGRCIVVSGDEGGVTRLYRRMIDQTTLEPLAGTEGATSPLFSPDGRSLAFFSTHGDLRVVAAEGGPPVTLCRVQSARGACWGDNGRIYFADGGISHSGILSVDAHGGSPRRETLVEEGDQSFGHRYPCLLPGGRGLLYVALGEGRYANSTIMVRQGEGAPDRVVLERAFGPCYLPTGHLLFARDEAVFAVEFDLESLTARGEPRLVLADAMVDSEMLGVVEAAVGPTGTLVYVPGRFEKSTRAVVWVDRHGATQQIGEFPDANDLRLSPDGRFAGMDMVQQGRSVWLVDLQSGQRTRMSGEAREWFGCFAPDGVSYYSVTSRAIVRGWLDKRVPATDVVSFMGPRSVASSPDSRWLLVGKFTGANNMDVLLLNLEKGGPAVPFLDGPAMEGDAMFSPDGRWVTYESAESDRAERYLRAFPPDPAQSGRLPVSVNGGRGLVWSPKSDAIYYWNGKDEFVVSAVTVETNGWPVIGAPQVLFKADNSNILDPQKSPGGLTPDGERFLMFTRLKAPEPPKEAIVVLNWFEVVRAKMRGGGSGQ